MLFFHFLLDGGDSVAEGRMAIFKHYVETRGAEVREVLTRELLERGDHRRGEPLFDGLSVCAVFRLTAARVYDEGYKRADKSKRCGQENIRKAVVDLAEAELLVDGGVAHGSPDDKRHNKQVSEAEYLTLQDVTVKTVAKLVGKDGAYFIGSH